MNSDSIFFMKGFPDFNVSGFDIDEYNKRFRESNVIIHASSRSIAYPEHWGCLSIKCAFQGNEYYQPGKRFYTVNDSNYLLLNEGTAYSSYIFSTRPVESFTINFSHEFEMETVNGLVQTPEDIIDNFCYHTHNKIEFTEKLYKHDTLVSPLLARLYSISSQVQPDKMLLKELYYRLMQTLLLREGHVQIEMQKAPATKVSTRKELYRRLHHAKDFMDSCYMSEVTLETIAGIAHLNTAYFLRLFRNYFMMTPYQYLIRRRLTEARKLIETSSLSVTEVCFTVGYQDITSFIKLFKKHFGFSPERYQKHFHKSVGRKNVFNKNKRWQQ